MNFTANNSNLNIEVTNDYAKYNTTIIIGTCFWRTTREKAKKLIKVVDEHQSLADIKSILDDITGFFTVITEAEDGLVVGVDCVNSIPIYYTQSDDGILITDSQIIAQDQAVSREINQTSREEYQTIGYVTSNHTLVDSIRLSEAASLLYFTNDSIASQRYFDFEYNKEPNHRKFDELNEIMKSITQRLVDYAGGRQIWVPLSGGLDSRLIATSLRQSGYDNLYSYTYGTMKNENSEAAISKRVANSLGIDWHFINYTPEQWYEWYRTEDRFNYDCDTFLNTVPPIKEMIALRDLISQGLMDHDAVIVPGHSGDMVAGSHLAGYLHKKSKAAQEQVNQVILTRHYRDGFNEYDSTFEEQFKSRIQETTRFNGGSGLQAMNACERWNWRERQSQWITSFVRQYDFYGLDWWLPMWDREFVDFWMATEPKQRLGKTYYRKAAQSLYESVATHPEPAPELSNVDKLKSAVAGSRVEGLLRPIHRIVRDNKKPAPEDVYGWRDGIIDFETYKEMYTGDTSTRAYRAMLILDEMAANYQDSG